MKLLYEEGFDEINSNAVPQYNGNISGRRPLYGVEDPLREMAWLGPWNCTAKGYGYTYDPMNRLTHAYYQEYEYFYYEAFNVSQNDWSGNTDAYNASYTYDKNRRSLTGRQHQDPSALWLPGQQHLWLDR